MRPKPCFKLNNSIIVQHHVPHTGIKYRIKFLKFLLVKIKYCITDTVDKYKDFIMFNMNNEYDCNLKGQLVKEKYM